MAWLAGVEWLFLLPAGNGFERKGGTVMTQEIMKALDGEIFAVWFLIGAAFVFWMQAGFAMCEAGFTRAKNAGNIIMKGPASADASHLRAVSI